MKSVTVKDKKELKEAVKSGADEIVVVGDYAKKLNGISKYMTEDAKKKRKIIGVISGSAFAALVTVNVIAAATAAPTGGASLGVAALVDTGAAAGTAATAGMTTAEIVTLVVIAACVGTTVLIDLLNEYRVESSEVRVGSIVFKKTYAKKTNKKSEDKE